MLENKQHYEGSGELELYSESNQEPLEDFKQCSDIIRSGEDWGKLWNEVAFHLGQEVGDGVFITGEGEALQKKKKEKWWD